ncbi:low affinity immunoglobulin gamma Fc region receptor II-a-like [Cheilinus undulatus]|uniref:low affinity immunoglobulin gamma Fc region receptor II-a-like n=1 Tax=Cheilinus undulatus TaxID=241271 RepID=UPI001BD4C6AA|nr:low affinity immunoglobulin gamma Fc region receptor II-a-like [Cheilinus undulatus]
MEITALCAVVVALRVLPNRSQFFQYESVSLRCGEQGICSNWLLKRNTLYETNQVCFEPQKSTYEPVCALDALYPLDSGVYWCESAAGECCEAVNITVTTGPVILESPALPVTEGDDVTLRCINRMTYSASLSPDEHAASSSNLPVDFYKDGLLIGSSSTGNMTIHSVNKSNEGLYKCNISGVGQSLDSWLSVRVPDPAVPDASPVPEPSVLRVICHVVAGTPHLLSTIILALIYRDRRRAARVVSEDQSHHVVMEME